MKKVSVYILMLANLLFSVCIEARIKGLKIQEYLRFKHPISRLSLSPLSRYLAYTELSPNEGKRLKVIDLSTEKIYFITRKQVGFSYLWAPHGYRLFYREQSHVKGDKQKVYSTLKVYDASLKKKILLRKIPYATSFLNLDPKDFTLRFLSKNRLHVEKITYPGARLAKWQERSSLPSIRKPFVTQNAVLWLSAGDRFVEEIENDGTKITSFSRSPDGRSIVWSTGKGLTYLSHQGGARVVVGPGRHPNFHPEKKSVCLFCR